MPTLSELSALRRRIDEFDTATANDPELIRLLQAGEREVLDLLHSRDRLNRRLVLVARIQATLKQESRVYPLAGPKQDNALGNLRFACFRFAISRRRSSTRCTAAAHGP